MRFEFRNVAEAEKRGRPAHHLADVDIVFDETPFAGLVLTGISIWGRKNRVPGMVISWSSWTYQDGEEIRFFSYLRNAKGASALQELRDAILKAFVDAHPEIAARADVGEAGREVSAGA